MYRLIKRQTILLSGAVHKMKHVNQIQLKHESHEIQQIKIISQSHAEK